MVARKSPRTRSWSVIELALCQIVLAILILEIAVGHVWPESEQHAVVHSTVVIAAGFHPIHPRKLYAQLLASPSVDERAQATLNFLCGCTGTARGYLFLVRDRALYSAASSGQGSPTADLIVEVERAWSQELETEPDANRTRTVDLPGRLEPDAPLQQQLWTSVTGVAYACHLLGTYRGTHWTPVGIAMLEAGAKRAPVRHAYIEVVCNAFIAAGDVPVQSLEPIVSPTS
jgi:hypothetical protein